MLTQYPSLVGQDRYFLIIAIKEEPSYVAWLWCGQDQNANVIYGTNWQVGKLVDHLKASGHKITILNLSLGQILSTLDGPLLNAHYALKPEPSPRFKHYKGTVYEVLNEAFLESTEETLVIYRAVDNPSKIWARPKSEFYGTIPRFEAL